MAFFFKISASNFKRYIDPFWNGALKFALALSICGLIFGSCATQKRCAARWPVTDSVYVHDSVFVKDTVIRFKIVADTIVDSVQIHDTVTIENVKIPVIYKTKKATIQNKFSRADAWIENGYLKISLVTNDSTFEATVQQVHREYILKQKQQKPAEPVKYVPGFYKAMPWVSGTLFLMLVIIIFILIRMIKS